MRVSRVDSSIASPRRLTMPTETSPRKDRAVAMAMAGQASAKDAAEAVGLGPEAVQNIRKRARKNREREKRRAEEEALLKKQRMAKKKRAAPTDDPPTTKKKQRRPPAEAMQRALPARRRAPTRRPRPRPRTAAPSRTSTSPLRKRSR